VHGGAHHVTAAEGRAPEREARAVDAGQGARVIQRRLVVRELPIGRHDLPRLAVTGAEAAIVEDEGGKAFLREALGVGRESRVTPRPWAMTMQGTGPVLCVGR